MYLAVSGRDALKRFLDSGDTRTSLSPDRGQPEFGRVVVAVAEQLDARLKSKGWDTSSVGGNGVGSLVAVSIRCLRSLGCEAQWSENGLVVNRQISCALLVALTGILESLEGEERQSPAPVRIRRYLSHPGEHVDPHAPFEPGEEVGDY